MARMLPAFWVCIIINTIIIAVLYNIHPSFKDAVIYIVTQLCGLNFYTGEWLREYGVGAPNGVLWTIIVQVQFFLIAPLAHKFLCNKSLGSLVGYIVGLTLLSIACNRFSVYLPEVVVKLIGVTVVPYLYFLMFGMMLWYHRDAIIPKFERIKWILLVTYVLWKTVENTLAFPHILDGVLYNTVTTLLMALVIAAFGFQKKIRVKKDYTYGFYLYHMVFINIAVELGFDSFMPLGQGILIVVIVAGCTIITTWLSNWFIETPVERLVMRRMFNG